MTKSEQLAAFVARASYEDLSSDARAELKIRILDSLGCAIGAIEPGLHGGHPTPARRGDRPAPGRPRCASGFAGKLAFVAFAGKEMVMEEFLFGLSWLILLLAPLLLAAQGGSQFMLLSPAFANGHPLHTKYANTGVQGGQNVSPPLAWHNPPDRTKSFALACVDRHPIARNWVHWLVINIPSDINVLGEGASGTAKMPARAKELNNTFGTVGWGGPQPPSGSGIHKYEFILYALNVESLDLGVNSKLEAFDKAIKGKVLAEVKLTGTYQR